MRRLRVLLSGVTLALAVLPAGAVVARADEEPPIRPEIGGPRVRPPQTGLRDADKHAPMTSTAPVRSRQLIVVVGGYGSEYKDPRPLRNFVDQVNPSGDYDVLYFGSDPAFPYNSYGSIDQNAHTLVAQVRAVSPSYGGVHIVTHSLGGNVADQAFAQGLSAADGVRTYVALSAPHGGSAAATLSEFTLAHLGPARADANAIARVTTFEADTRAAQDLTRIRPVGAPPGVTRLDLRLATDMVVSSDDAQDPGVQSRTLLPTTERGRWDGHTGILMERSAVDLTRQTLATGIVPPKANDRVGDALSYAVSKTADHLGLAMLLVTCTVCAYLGIRAYLRRRRVFLPPV